MSVDQPIAALIRDLKDRGLLNETLVVWSGEFGRTPLRRATMDVITILKDLRFGWPEAESRGHNPRATDDYGYRVVDKPCTIHDLHATILHLLGIDHTRLTYRFSGRDFRLTDVFGNPIHDVIA